jgi:hypothetical protein
MNSDKTMIISKKIPAHARAIALGEPSINAFQT